MATGHLTPCAANGALGASYSGRRDEGETCGFIVLRSVSVERLPFLTSSLSVPGSADLVCSTEGGVPCAV